MESNQSKMNARGWSGSKGEASKEEAIGAQKQKHKASREEDKPRIWAKTEQEQDLDRKEENQQKDPPNGRDWNTGGKKGKIA